MRLGESAQNFILKDQYGKDFELYKNLDHKVLLVFYPKDHSPVCSRQLDNYNRNLFRFSKLGIRLVGISTDDTKSHNLFCNNLELKFSLLADEDKTVSKMYNAINILGINKRKIVFINTDKKIIFERYILPFYYLDTGQILEKVKVHTMDLLT